jgi:hypothetical protein
MLEDSDCIELLSEGTMSRGAVASPAADEAVTSAVDSKPRLGSADANGTTTVSCSTDERIFIYILLSLVSHAVPSERGKVCPADKLQVRLHTLPLAGLARSKLDTLKRGHSAQF